MLRVRCGVLFTSCFTWADALEILQEPLDLLCARCHICVLRDVPWPCLGGGMSCGLRMELPWLQMLRLRL